MANGVLYIILMTIIGFLSMVIDKRKAIKNKWRISEKTLFLISIFGGSLGVLIGMYLVRHKTKHIKFTLGIPVILIIQIVIIYLINFQ